MTASSSASGSTAQDARDRNPSVLPELKYRDSFIPLPTWTNRFSRLPGETIGEHHPSEIVWVQYVWTR
jgi:hypothetical protein